MPPDPVSSRPVGPYMLRELVDDLPLENPETPGKKDVTITCLEAWSQNLYVGTSAHEILHLVSIPSTPNPSAPGPSKAIFILASRLQAPAANNAAPDAYIKQILVLPTVSRALVLSSSGLLSFYSLPEFSPAFAGTKLKEVAHIGGLDLDDQALEVQGDKVKVLVMVLAKSKIRMIRIGEEARLTKDIPVPGTLNALRRGTIACVATKEKYALLDVENMHHLPLFSLSSNDPSTPPEEESAISRNTPSPGPIINLPDEPRSSARTTRERRASSASTRENVATAVHGRSVSVGNVSRMPSPSNRGGPARRGSGRGDSSRSPSRHQNRLSPSGASTPRATTPTSPRLSGSGRASPVPPPPGSPQSPTSRRGSSAAQPPQPPPSRDPAPPPPQLKIGVLKPLIASPSPGEFLLTTGTIPEEPGVGMFVDINGDVTRGTIQFTRYPDQLLVQGGWVIAAIPGIGLDLQRWDIDDPGQIGPSDRRDTIVLEQDVQLKKVLALEDTILPEVGQSLRLVHIVLRKNEQGEAISPVDTKREEEEQVIAQRISTVSTNLVVFAGRKVWNLLPSPLVLRLDCRLPKFTEENFDGIVARVRSVLKVLEEVIRIEPTTEQEFHEVSYIRQKCGLLVLGELLRISARQTTDISAVEIIRVEQALLESGLDPRFIVALFGDAFTEDIAEAGAGVWVYGGIRDVYDGLKSSLEVGTSFTRDVLLLLKRFLVAWREKRGYGSVADDKAIFETVDSALLRVMLMLDSAEYLVEKGQTVVPEGDIRLELHRLVESPLENQAHAIKMLEKYRRLYVLAIFYASKKRYGDVLKTWRRILEDGDGAGEFQDGEERMKNYLLRLKDAALVEEYGGYLCSRNSALGIQVFADEKARVKFDPSKVLEILRKHAPHSVRGYVEYLVVHKKNTQYSNELINLYLDDLINTLSTDDTATDRLKLSYESYRVLDSPKPTYRDFILANSTPKDEDHWWGSRLRLLDLLGGESGYDVPKVLSTVEKYRDVLVPEMVILYGREGRHADALRLLTHGLEDFDTAINYCLFGGMSIFETRLVLTNREEQKKLFKVLLDEFLELENMSERLQQTAMLLEKFGGWLDVTHVLSVIPDSWSIEILSGFLISALRQLVRERAEAGVARSLHRTQNLKAAGEYVDKCDEIGPTIEEG